MGFRPFVYGLAASMGLKGYVTNTSEGVSINIEGEGTETFLARLQKEAPELAKISSVDVTSMSHLGYTEFGIQKSEGVTDPLLFTLVSPDVATCPDCLGELMDVNDRRHLYPFINCTNCGPRYTITRRIPYDRPNTTMSAFGMCPECEKEYYDPSDRRFHAQPNACSKCGPQVSLNGSGDNDPVREAAGLIKIGMIVAVKGIGGFHLCCDALNRETVEKLRFRKRKSNKPFALMAPDIETIKKYCMVSEEEKTLLLSNRKPIVLLRKLPITTMPDAVAPGNDKLGFMLPYTPLHYVMFKYLDGIPIVATSGNLSEEPIQIDGKEAVDKLRGIADAFLDHDRGIFMRVDDSVLKVAGGGSGRVRFVRRARGYVPEPIALQEDGPDVLAVGADLKNTFTIMKGGFAIVSQHIGDMENMETLGFFEETLKNLMDVYRVKPVAIAHDMHPDYMSTRWALDRIKNIPPLPLEGKGKGEWGGSLQAFEKGSVTPCQHHHAHIASVMAEKGIKGPLIGIAFDGTGYGTDSIRGGTLWGGEFLIADAAGFKRAAHFSYVPLPGGEMAIKEPWRAAISYIYSAVGDEAEDYLRRIGFIEKYGADKVKNVLKVLGIREVSPLSSGAGRLFDAVSAILGIADINTFEGEAAIALEGATADNVMDDYPLDISYREPIEVDFSFAVIGIIGDMLGGVGKDVIAAKFHNTVVEAVSRVTMKLSLMSGLRDVALSGGVFQNDYLLVRAEERLRADGFSVFTNELVPVNDGGISLGQAYILRARLKGR